MREAEEGLGRNDAWWKSGPAMVVGIAAGTVAVHLATGGRYGFNRDELMALEDARHLAWGYVQYPPMTAFFGRMALGVFGTSLVGFRFFAAVVQAVALVLTGLMAKELGEGSRRSGNPGCRSLRSSGRAEDRRYNESENPRCRSLRSSGRAEARRYRGSEKISGDGRGGGTWAQVVATLAGVPFCLGGGALMQYISFDYVCWVLVAYCMVRVLKSGEARWWLGVGAGIGLGMMAKYTMGFLAAGVVAGVLLTSARRYLRSGWLWGGALVAMGIFAPNFLWQWRRNFVSLEFLEFLHERDVKAGLTNWFLAGQMELTLLAFPLALAGIYFYFFAEEGKQYRALGWMYAVPLALFVAMRGRNYYLAPAYPMLYAAGAVWCEKWLSGLGWGVEVADRLGRRSLPRRPEDGEIIPAIQEDGRRLPRKETQEPARCRRYQGNRMAFLARVVKRGVWAALVADVVVAGAVALPIAPVNSAWWKFAANVDSVFAEEIGWPEFVETVAQVRDRLPAEERARARILAGNYGELGALNLYGEKYGLPRAISGVNSSWERGYGEAGPGPVIVVGYSREFLEKHFGACEVAGHPWNRYGVANEETMEDADIFVCRGLKESWEEFWKGMRKFA